MLLVNHHLHAWTPLVIPIPVSLECMDMYILCRGINVSCISHRVHVDRNGAAEGDRTCSIHHPDCIFLRYNDQSNSTWFPHASSQSNVVHLCAYYRSMLVLLCVCFSPGLLTLIFTKTLHSARDGE